MVLGLLRALPMAPVASDDEALAQTERRWLIVPGIGWVDVQPLASALLAGVGLWTLDRRLCRPTLPPSPTPTRAARSRP